MVRRKKKRKKIRAISFVVSTYVVIYIGKWKQQVWFIRGEGGLTRVLCGFYCSTTICTGNRLGSLPTPQKKSQIVRWTPFPSLLNSFLSSTAQKHISTVYPHKAYFLCVCIVLYVRNFIRVHTYIVTRKHNKLTNRCVCVYVCVCVSCSYIVYIQCPFVLGKD